MVGLMAPEDALERAYDAGYDLVEVSPQADPPVCKILDYGKYKYEQQKKAAEARKKQKTIDVKEVKMRPNIESHDYNVKLRNARRFLEDGNKVKFTVRFRGREVTHEEQGREILDQMAEELANIGKIDQTPKLEGKQMIMIMSAESQKA
jgi:translation initiation factor IF-3